MKRFLLTISIVLLVLSASATDVWIWKNGEYHKTSIDSITFAEPTSYNVGGDIDPNKFSVYSDYKGTLKLTVMGMSAGSATPNVSVTKVTDGVANVEFDDFSAFSFEISGFSASNVIVTPNADGSYSLSQTNFTTTANLNGESGDLTNCSLSGMVMPNGSITLNVSFTVSSVPVSGSYSGNQ